MEILGIGGAELIAIMIIMLVVAGPKRMIQWAYILGRYVAKARALWAETMTYIQKEFKDAGVDIELPKEMPTRGGLNRQITSQVEKAISPVTKPVQEALDETTSQLKDIKQQATIREPSSKPLPVKPPSASTKAPSSNGSADFGTWSGDSSDQQS
jgi:Sec-independent protein translocase protein TatA